MRLEKKTKNYVNAQLRRIFRWTSAYKETQERCQVAAGIYRCEGCKELISKNGKYKGDEFLDEPVRSSKLYVDHIDPFVPIEGWISDADWAARCISRMMLPAKELQYLCHKCHTEKTSSEASKRKKARNVKRQSKDI